MTAIYMTKPMKNGLEIFHILKNKYQVLEKVLKLFMKEILVFLKIRKQALVTVSVKHYSPYIAKEWAQLIVNQINIFYSEKDRKTS